MNILDYLDTELSTFEEKPFSPIDSLVLTQLCMTRVDDRAPSLAQAVATARPLAWARRVSRWSDHAGVVPADLLRAERFPTMFTGLASHKIKELLFAVSASPRFRTIRIANASSWFDSQRQVQFAAMTFAYKDLFTYVAFRGTDGTFTGWREDFNMAFTWPVPGQAQAVSYLNDVAGLTRNPLIIGGHSKGGNLATYAAVCASPTTQARISAVYNHDGPGFRPEAFGTGDYDVMAARVHKTVPEESVIGMMLETREDWKVVHSTARGIQQHDAFTWEVDPERTDFVYVDKLTDNAQLIRRIFHDWIARYSCEELEKIVDALFCALESSDASSVDEIIHSDKTLAIFVEAIRGSDSPQRDVIMSALGELGGTAARAVGQSVVDLIAGAAKALVEKLPSSGGSASAKADAPKTGKPSRSEAKARAGRAEKNAEESGGPEER